MGSLILEVSNPFEEKSFINNTNCFATISTYRNDVESSLQNYSFDEKDKNVLSSSLNDNMTPETDSYSQESVSETDVGIETESSKNDKTKAELCLNTEKQMQDSGENAKFDSVEYKLELKSKIPRDIFEKYGATKKSYKKDVHGYSRDGSKEKLQSKQKKWKPMALDDLGLNISLFPRPIKNNFKIDKNASKLFYEIESECDSMDKLTESWTKYQDLEGCINRKKKLLRKDRDRRIEKAHRQVKTKHCRSVRNNDGRIHLYVHHRVYKLMEMEVQRMSYLPSRRKEKNDLKREELKQLQRPKGHYNTPRTVAPVAHPQSLAHALDHNNVANDIDSNIVSLLISLQHRDLTPEDYEVLLQLDESIAPKTVSNTMLNSFRTEDVNESHFGDMCPICMDPYELNQIRKYLPCNHVFHSSCIDVWLQNSSLNCPIDNLPVGGHS